MKKKSVEWGVQISRAKLLTMNMTNKRYVSFIQSYFIQIWGSSYFSKIAVSSSRDSEPEQAGWEMSTVSIQTAAANAAYHRTGYPGGSQQKGMLIER